MVSPVAIVAVGGRTPLGQVAAAAAALRAGVTVALRQHPFMVDVVGDMMPSALDADLDPRLLGPARLVALAEDALRQACAPLAVPRPPRPRVPVFLALPEVRPGFSAEDAEAVRTGLTRLNELPVELSEVRTFAQGHAAGLAALAAAADRLQDGMTAACLVGGVDSYNHPDTMEWLDAHRHLVGSVSRSGFVPGEGAGFCLLTADRPGDRTGPRPLARVTAVAGGRETKLIRTDDVCLGEGLTATVRAAVDGLKLPAERVNDIVCDINGERYRTEEWGFACLRLSPYMDAPTAYLSPATGWGDVGAASGPLFLALAAQAFARGRAAGRTLVWASSDGGLRGAALVEAAKLS
jgi:3-oxoacyl-[acyl-carrier-protein] synthase I